MRTAEISRKTAETDVYVSICLDGSGNSEISTGVGFLDHMLTLFAKHGRCLLYTSLHPASADHVNGVCKISALSEPDVLY